MAARKPPAGRRSRVLNPARLVATVALVALGAVWASPVHAQELPPEILALETDDDGRAEEALAALAARDDRESLVMTVLLDAKKVARLSSETHGRLLRLAGRERMRFSNMVLRRLLRDPEAPDDLRRVAVATLAEAGGIADVSALGDAIDEFPLLATQGLVRIGDVPAIRALERGGGETPHDAVLVALLELGQDHRAAALAERVAASDGERREWLVGELERVTGKSLGTDVEAWRSWARRTELAAELAVEDYDTADATTRALLERLRAGEARLADDLRAILLDEGRHVFARDKAALLLGEGGVTAARQDLLKAAANLQPGSTRLYAAEALAKVGDLSVVIPLVKMLVHDEDRDRLQAKRGRSGEYFPVDPAFVRTLHRLGVQGAFEPVLPLMAGTYRTRMHRDCLRALREIHPDHAFGYEPDSSQSEREAAMERLRAWWRHGRERLGIAPAPDLGGREAFEADAAELVEKLGTFKFLHQLRAKNALIIVAELARPQLETALSHEDLHTRTGAADVLSGARLRTATPALTARLAVEENTIALTRFLAALAVCARCDADGNPAASPEETRALRARLVELLTHPALEVRIGAVRVLGVVGDPQTATPVVFQALADPANDVASFRTQASGSLLQLAVRAALPTLLEELGGDDIARRAEAADRLRELGFGLEGYDPDLGDADLERVLDRLHASVFSGARR